MWYHSRFHFYDMIVSNLWYHSFEPIISLLKQWYHRFNICYRIHWISYKISCIWYHRFGTMISYFQHVIPHTYDFIGLQLWYHIHYMIYDIRYKIWHQVWKYHSYEIMCDINHIPAYPTDSDQHKDSPVTFHAWTGCHLRLCRMLSAREPIDSQTSACRRQGLIHGGLPVSSPARFR